VRGTITAACALLAALAVVQPVGASDPWAKLHRPLHLPRLAPGAPCPVSPVDRRIDWTRANIFGGSGIGRGPVYPGLGGSGGQLYVRPDDQFGGPWADGKVFWYVRPSYRGRVLIRGRRLDGPQRLGFNGRVVPNRSCESTTTASHGRGSRPEAAAYLRACASLRPVATASRSTARPSVGSWSSRSRLASADRVVDKSSQVRHVFRLTKTSVGHWFCQARSVTEPCRKRVFFPSLCGSSGGRLAAGEFEKLLVRQNPAFRRSFRLHPRQ
jgi:hypothetical protein